MSDNHYTVSGTLSVTYSFAVDVDARDEDHAEEIVEYMIADDLITDGDAKNRIELEIEQVNKA